MNLHLLPPPPPDRLAWFLRLIVGGAFITAGALKIADPEKFVLAVSNYRLVPHELLNAVAIFLPWVELTAGAFVLAGVWLRPAALLLTGLTAVFFAVIVSALARGLNIECGCFGTVGGQHVGLVNLAIDATLLFLAALLAERSKFRGASTQKPRHLRSFTGGQCGNLDKATSSGSRECRLMEPGVCMRK